MVEAHQIALHSFHGCKVEREFITRFLLDLRMMIQRHGSVFIHLAACMIPRYLFTYCRCGGGESSAPASSPASCLVSRHPSQGHSQRSVSVSVFVVPFSHFLRSLPVTSSTLLPFHLYSHPADCPTRNTSHFILIYLICFLSYNLEDLVSSIHQKIASPLKKSSRQNHFFLKCRP